MLPSLFARGLSALIDPTIILSFSRPGFWLHRELFNPADLSVNLTGKRYYITGANAGIGYATALGLAQRGAEVTLLCRNQQRGAEALSALQAATHNQKLALEVLDISDLKAIRALAGAIVGPIHGLIHNAGVLPARFEASASGHEMCLATHVLGPHLLTRLLLPHLHAAQDSRVIFVSSGGMYTQRLHIGALSDPPEEIYDGVACYARTKRAQVVLSELWAASAPDITFSCMHPGWADTLAVRTSLPRFHQLTQSILRTPEEGADTIVWLAACARLQGKSGQFWFDRQPRSTHYLPWTRESATERQELWALCERLTA